ncbi:DUF4424 domain-containing protein [Acinetobacter cumulans]|uniref:DUF4424 domain-containing protein n=1 Tax=Acinetobacter cumulans TaxID=2136182 RepID=A0A498D1N0_9GAMM|nr:DUF4424 family protein [Acinetobacter cumulans]RKG48949.1 DUF4424 domain-containing protein [Acinetobacter cumulans]RLL39189.1 DUF4424 domain-containing protein [Acinetobacter cumulans]
MTKPLIALLMFWPVLAMSNDSTGYVATGGVQYLKNKDIQMFSENLFISKKIIKVDYQFKNLSNKDVTETVLFPLPKVENFFESDFANTEKLLKSFKVQVNGKAIKPEMHVRTFIQKDEKTAPIDMTESFKQCGFTEKDMLNPWSRQDVEYETFEAKLRNCKNVALQKTLPKDPNETISWSSQVIYSWKQTFKANTLTRVQHQYAPLVGGSVALYPDEDNQTYCMDQNFKAGLRKAKSQHAPFQALGYILKTGANWAKPIQDFKLTIERDAGELVSFCWAGKVKKISAKQFQMVEKNFVPKHDLDIIFVHVKSGHD